MDFDDHYREQKDSITGDRILSWEIKVFGISSEQAKELIEELSHSYITSQVVKDLLSALHQFVIENELAKRTDSAT